MSQIFVFTAGDSGARVHLGKTIVQPIDLGLVERTVSSPDRDRLREVVEKEGGLWAWGAFPTDRNRHFWEQMSVGDWVLCVFENTYHYAGRVTSKLESDALARLVWGERDGTTWSLMYFLTRPTELSKPVASLANNLNSAYRGFTRIGDERIAKIEKDFGSVDLFMSQAVLGSSPVATSYFLVRSNADSEYGDEIGVRYHFTNTVPNSRALEAGGKAVVDRKTSEGPVLIGYGSLERARREEKGGKTHFISAFRNWTPIGPRPLTERERAAVQAVGGYNVQHAVRPITREVYEMLTQDQVTPSAAATDLRKAADAFAAALREAGVAFGAQHDGLVRSFVASLATKPLAILTGLSGSGKTQIALRFGEWLGGGLLTAAVRPDWTGSEALFGFEDGLKPAVEGRQAWVVPEALAFMMKAREHPEKVHLLVLDEMNLAHVERYFADALSGMESQQPCLPNLARGADGCWRTLQGEDVRVSLPDNLWVVGTVNVDETTYMFSPKVLDRANTFEFRVAASDLVATSRKPRPCVAGDGRLVGSLLSIARDSEWHLRNPATFAAELSTRMLSLHELLARYGYEFGHRTYFEALRFAAMAEQSGVGALPEVLDRIVMQKILPRLHGARRRMELPLLALLEFCGDLPAELATDADLPKLQSENRSDPARLPLSFDKARRMLRNLRANQFVSFTE